MFISLVNFSLIQRQIWTSNTMSQSYPFIRVKRNYKRKLFCFYRQIVWLFCCAIIIDQEVTTKNSTWSLTPYLTIAQVFSGTPKPTNKNHCMSVPFL